MKQRSRFYLIPLIVLLPVLLLLTLNAEGVGVRATGLEPVAPSFSVSRNILSFMAHKEAGNFVDPRPQRFEIINTGSEPLNWNVSEDHHVPWLEIDPTSGLNGAPVEVSVDTSVFPGTLALPSAVTETLTVSASGTPQTEVITVILVLTSAEMPWYTEDFETYSSGDNPTDWFDTASSYSMSEQDLFDVRPLGGQVFRTRSQGENIHSHYIGTGSAALSSYEYTGRMRSDGGGAGVTFFSQYRPNGEDAYYRLRAWRGGGSIIMNARGTDITCGTDDTGVNLDMNEWYRFRIRAEDIGTRTDIKARVWAEGDSEPSGWQVECYDDSPTRLTAGTVGVWSRAELAEDRRYWDDLSVSPLPPEADTTPPFTHSHNPAPGAANADPSTNIVVHVADSQKGVDDTTLAMTVDGASVNPTITGSRLDYVLSYDPPSVYDEGDVVEVRIDACDLARPTANCMTEVYSFTIQSSPVIDVWYGPHQFFGHIGNPQRWVDILGNASDPEGVASMSYSLNGGSEMPLSVGPDGARLVSEGDFHVELAYTDLINGLNQVRITATDSFGSQSVEMVTVEYVAGNVWPEDYDIDWSAVSAITETAQIVDGLWSLEGDSIRPAVIGYDRLVAIGDLSSSWDEYEVTVPVTINEEPPDPTNGGVGIILRWQGHNGSAQPRTDWWDMGAYGYFRWSRNGSNLALRVDRYSPLENSSVQLDVGIRYIFKMRVQNAPGPGGLYSLKVWPASELEPSGWQLYAQDGADDLAHGSLLLVAHQVDASFGDVTVTSGPLPDSTPPIISNVQVVPGDTSAAVTWTTNEPATSRVDYGLTAAYEMGSEQDGALVTAHTINLTGLTSGSVYHYQITSVDDDGNEGITLDLTFRTTGKAPGVASDDFNTCDLDTEIWEFINPLGDATLTTVGTFTDNAWLSIAVPGGVSHSLSGSNTDAPRLMQSVNDADFEIEVKFESVLAETYQIQGVLVEQDQDQHFLRFEFFSVGSDTRIYAARYDNGSLNTQINKVITGTNAAPLYMRVSRGGDTWTQSYSFDGQNWTTAGNFDSSITVNKVGVFAGNSDDGNSPAHTALVDYFFNTASPIVPEDGDRNILTVNSTPVGNGTVAKAPDQATYECGQVVTLEATGNPGWSFSGWSGDLSGSTNPTTVTMNGSKVVTATFTQDEYTLTVNPPVGNGTVAVNPVEPVYLYGDVVTLTATPDPGWSFSGWSGDLLGNTNPTTLTMNGDKQVTATFTQDEFYIFLPLIVRSQSNPLAAAKASPTGSGTSNPEVGLSSPRSIETGRK